MPIVVLAKMLPILQAVVPDSPISVSATEIPPFFKEEHGPIAPHTLYSREVNTSKLAANPIISCPASGESSGVFLKTLLNDSLNTDYTFKREIE
jgi:hypothetical protein